MSRQDIPTKELAAEDPYLNPGVARSLHEALPTSDLSLLPKKGHWPQLDGAPEVAQLLLSLPAATPA